MKTLTRRLQVHRGASRRTIHNAFMDLGTEDMAGRMNLCFHEEAKDPRSVDVTVPAGGRTAVQIRLLERPEQYVRGHCFREKGVADFEVAASWNSPCWDVELDGVSYFRPETEAAFSQDRSSAFVVFQAPPEVGRRASVMVDLVRPYDGRTVTVEFRLTSVPDDETVRRPADFPFWSLN